MANSDKNILIVPNTNQSGLPNIQFVGSSSAPISLSVLDDNTLSFSGSQGQLFSINNNLTSGTIFSVNDVSGIPSIEVDASGAISLARFGGNIGIGKSSPNAKLDITGSTVITGNLTVVGTISGTSYQGVSGGGGGTPGGTNQTIQFNSGSTFSGSTNLIYNFTTNTLSGATAQFTTVSSSNLSISNTASFGTTSPQAGFHFISNNIANPPNGDLIFEKQNGWLLYLNQIHSNDVNAASHSPQFILQKGRGTKASPSAVQNGDQIGGFFYRAYDGATYQQRAGISAFVDGSPTANTDVPMKIRMFAGVSSGADTDERLSLARSAIVVNEFAQDVDFRIEGTASTNLFVTDAGLNRVGIDTATPSYKLDVNGPAGIKEYLVIEAAAGTGNDSLLIFNARTNGNSNTNVARFVADAANNTTDAIFKLQMIDADGGGWDDGFVFKASPAGDDYTYTGLGTNSPTARLDVVGNNTTAARFSAGSVIVSGNLTVTGSIFVSGSSIYGQVAELTSSTSNYTLVRQDSGKFLNINSGSAVTVTVPTGLPTGFTVSLCQLGAGQVTVTGAVGVTINNRQLHNKTAGQYAVASLVGVSADTYIFVGDTSV